MVSRGLLGLDINGRPHSSSSSVLPYLLTLFDIPSTAKRTMFLSVIPLIAIVLIGDFTLLIALKDS